MQANKLNVSYDNYIDIHILPNTAQFDLLTLTQHLVAHGIFADKDVRQDKWMGSNANVITIFCMHSLCSNINLNSLIHNIGMIKYSVQ